VERKSKVALTSIIAGVLVLVTLTTNVILFVLVQKDVKSRVREDMESKTLMVLHALETHVDKDAFTRLVTVGDPKDPYYETLRVDMERIKQRSGLKYLYSLAKTPKGQLIYVVDGNDPKAKGFSALGDKATSDEFKGFDAAQSKRTPWIDVSKSKEWGHLMTVYYPLIDAKGRFAGVLGADNEMGTLYAAIAKRTRFFGLLIALVTLLGLVATILAALIIRKTERSRLRTHDNLEKSYEALEQSQKALAASEETKRALFNAATESVLLLDAKGVVLVANEAMAQQFGATPEEVTGKNLGELEGDEARTLLELKDKVVQTGAVEHCERRGEEKHLTYSLYPIIDGDRVIEVAVFAQDIGWRQKLEAALAESEERFRSAFENAAVAIALTNLDGRLIKVNRSFCEIFETSEEQAAELTLAQITADEDIEKDAILKQRLLTGEIPYYHIEKKFRGVTGKHIWGILSASTVRGPDGKPLYAIGMVQNINDRKLAEFALKEAKQLAEDARNHAEHMARTDFLTDLFNRRAFIERFEQEMDRASRDKKPIGLIMADVDHFKKVNDTYGHEVGDKVLIAFAQCLERNCRKYDFVGRQGGEEFLVALPESNMDQSMQIAERIRQSVSELAIEVEGLDKPIRITSSFGVSVYRSGLDTFDEVMIRADEAAYLAKTGGRNKVCKKATRDKV